MARYAYDVNTTQRYIDVHKQFQGGLKTVDTDDALGAVFLRDAENVSLSEFGFIEKRYGTFEKFRANLSVISSDNLQGYWEFLGKYIIVALNGRIYYQLLTSPESAFTEITQFYTDADLTYPKTLAAYLGLESDFSVGSGFSGFQTTRPMGAANIANVLYIFTGKYPIYIAEENDELKAYLFAKETPNYAELVVTGHNLLEDDYDDIYYESFDTIELPTEVLPESSENLIEITEHNHSPKLPYAKDGTLEFNLAYNLKSELKTPFNFDVNESLIYDVTLESLEYRPSGAGATDLSFKTISTSDYTANTLNNVLDGIDASINSDDLDAFSAENLYERTLPQYQFDGATTTLSSVTSVPLTKYDWKPKYRRMKNILDLGSGWGYNRETQLSPSGSFLNVNYRQLTLDIDPVSIATVETPTGKRLGFVLKNTLNEEIDIETRNREIRTLLNTYFQKDPRNKKLYFRKNQKNSNIRSTQVALCYQVDDTFPGASPLDATYTKTGEIILFNFTIPAAADQIEASYEFVGTTKDFIQVNIKYLDDVISETYAEIRKVLEYYDIDASSWKTILYSELQNAYPMSRAQRDIIKNIINLPQTVVNVYSSDNSHTHELVKSYTLKDGLIVEGGRYYVDIPEDATASNHYAIEFKTTLLGVEVTNAQSQTSYTSVLGTNSTFLQVGYLPTEDLEDEQKLFYNPRYIFKTTLTKDVLLKEAYTQYNYTLFEVDNLAKTLVSKSQLGSNFLNVKILEGLLSGTYDFKFNYKLDIDVLNDAYDKISQDVVQFTYIAKDITVTEEKLTDYTFFQGERAHPIWSCNKVLDHFNKLMVYGSLEMPNSVFYSFPDRPFYFPSYFYLDFTNDNNYPIVSITPYMNILVVQSEDSTWGIRGNSGLIDAPNPYVPFSINSTIGTIAPKSVRPIRNKLFFLSKQGVVAINSLYAVDESYNIDFMDRNIRNIVPQDSEAVGVQFDNQYWLNFPNFGITLRWYIDKKAWVQDKYGAWNDFKGVFKYQVNDGKLEFITKPSRFETSGNYNLYKVGVDYSLTHDLSGLVVAKFETSYLNQNYPFHPKNYKETKLDFTLQNEYNQSKESYYSMDENEDIVGDSVHTIDNIDVIPNHFYRVVYNFDNPEYPAFDGGTFGIITEDNLDGGDFNTLLVPSTGNIIFKLFVTTDGGTFDEVSPFVFDGGNFGLINYDTLSGVDFFLNPDDIDGDFDHLRINAVTVKEFDSNTTYNVKAITIGDGYVEFLLPAEIKGSKIDIQIEGEFTNYAFGADMYDTTYDDKLTFKTWVISEDQTLNLDNIESYDQSKADLGIDFNNRLGTWVFGTSDFGKKITAVKTIKLSGKGYNSKIYMEDYSKSKWTLESVGITYKMKRARSR